MNTSLTYQERTDIVKALDEWVSEFVCLLAMLSGSFTMDGWRTYDSWRWRRAHTEIDLAVARSVGVDMLRYFEKTPEERQTLRDKALEAFQRAAAGEASENE